MSNLRTQTLRGSVWTVIGTVANVPLAIGLTLVLARALSPQGYGRFALLTFVVLLVNAVAGLGLTNVVQRRVSLDHGRADPAAQRRWLQMAQTVCTGQMIVVLAACAWLFHGSAPLLLITGYVVLNWLSTPAATLLTSTNQSAIVARTAMVSAVVSAAVEICLAVWSHNPDLVLASGMLAGTVPHLALIWLAGPRAMTRPGWGVVPISRSDWRFALTSLASGQIAVLVFSRSELLFFGPTMAYDRGRFAAAGSIGARTSLLIDSLFGSIPAALTTLHGRDEADYHRGVAALFRLSTVLFTVLFPSAFVCAVIAAPYVFPAQYGDLRWWVLPLIAISLLQTAAQPALAAWSARGSADVPLAAGIAGAVIDVVLSASLVPSYGLRGAVIANVGAGLVYLIVIAWAFRTNIARSLYRTYLVTTAVATALGAAVATGVALMFATRDPLVLAAIPAALLLSLMVLAIVRPLGAADAELLGSGRLGGLVRRTLQWCVRTRSTPV
ncbi:hypothetical protein Back2_13780 [Nocardioides baekrokdamisoli]|uniref:Uncharacterized protein n=1 Tax=Nocardioides baekrokdamisoli TaxID=1804624 RepID=A0A3G9ITY8_9ACTN|nr:polysaccharide biosynthesis C-terminal domain-containing protein [Nocardioides baekrokdamisoli]BBH17091.1 hypothetical protein Back2_13780 [Nocardioides baekrokdamisoli]